MKCIFIFFLFISNIYACISEIDNKVASKNLNVLPLKFKKDFIGNITPELIGQANPDIIFITIENEIDCLSELFNYIENAYKYFFVFEVPFNPEISICLASQYEIKNPICENNSKVFHFLVENEFFKNHIYTLLEKQTESELQTLAKTIKGNSYWDNLDFLLFKENDQINDAIKIQELILFYNSDLKNNHTLSMSRPSGRAKFSTEIDSEKNTSVKGSASINSESKNGNAKFSGSIEGEISKNKEGKVKKGVKADIEYIF